MEYEFNEPSELTAAGIIAEAEAMLAEIAALEDLFAGPSFTGERVA